LPFLTFSSSYVAGEHSDALYFWKHCLKTCFEPHLVLFDSCRNQKWTDGVMISNRSRRT